MTSLADLALPLVKTLPAETAHAATIQGLKLGLGLPKVAPGQWQTGITLKKSGLALANPIGLAAGFDKNAEVFKPMSRFGFGWIECGTVTPEPQDGNPKPRLFRLPADQAVINRMGFNNQGLFSFTRRLMAADACDIPIGANIGANKDSEDRIGDYVSGIGFVWAYADYLTLNISSPNTVGLRGLQDGEALIAFLNRCGEAVDRARQTTAKPVFLKLAPDLEDKAVDDMIAILDQHGSWLDGLIISNTTNTRPDKLTDPRKTETGGLSGAPLMALSTQQLVTFAKALSDRFDLIGSGGIMSARDVYTKIRSGASAVQLYSALVFKGPGMIAKLNAELAALLSADGFTSVEQAVGVDL